MLSLISFTFMAKAFTIQKELKGFSPLYTLIFDSTYPKLIFINDP